MLKISAQLTAGLRSRLPPTLGRTPLRLFSAAEGSPSAVAATAADRLSRLISFFKKPKHGKKDSKGSGARPKKPVEAGRAGEPREESGPKEETPDPDRERQKELEELLAKQKQQLEETTRQFIERYFSPKNPKGPEESQKRQAARDNNYLRLLYSGVAALMVAVFWESWSAEGGTQQMTYETFLAFLGQKKIKEVEVVTDTQNVRKTHHLIIKTEKAAAPKIPKTPETPQSSNNRAIVDVIPRLLKGTIQAIKVVDPETIQSKPGTRWQMTVFSVDDFLANFEREQLAAGYDSHELIPVRFTNEAQTSKVVWKILTDALLIMGGIFVLYSARDFKTLAQRMGPQTSKAIKTFEVKKLQGGFNSVAGLDNPKLEIQEFVDFLKDPFIYASLGARMPKGALLTGPPGTGKTLLAKACAVESGVSFFAVSGSDFVEKYVGIGSQNVRKLFQEAKLRAPSVIFIDEIDAIGKKRNETAMFTNTERENTLNQLLVELDGFDSNTSVVVLAATNRPETLDPALRRPGRLDRHIALTLPDVRSREAIFRLYLAKLQIEATDMDYLAKRLASLTPQFSGADISNLCNEAAILAAREEVAKIQLRHFEEAAERVIAGLRRDNLISKDERVLVATHESGHAVASWFLKGADPLVKVTIVPRSKGALGYAQYLTPDDDIHTKSALMDRITFILGGRVAEEIFFGKISTGAQDDLEKAFKLAHALVTRLGMTEEFGYSNFTEEENRNQYMPTKENLKFSDRTQNRIDELITEIITTCHARCTQLLTEKREFVGQLRDSLLEKESLTQADLTAILGERASPNEGTMGFRLHSEDQFN